MIVGSRRKQRGALRTHDSAGEAPALYGLSLARAIRRAFIDEQEPLWSAAALRVAEEHAARLVEQPEWVLSEVLLSPDLAPHILAQLPTKEYASHQGDVPRVAPRLEGDAEEAREGAPARDRREQRRCRFPQLAGAVRPVYE